MRWLISLLELVGRIAKGKLRREATVDEVAVQLIETLQEERKEFRERCTLLQQQVDRLIGDVGTVRLQLVDAAAQLRDCKEQHAHEKAANDELRAKVAGLEAKVAELERGAAA
jgi:chromosome segregation ATPase